MLELRPSCEHCDADLPADALDARICTFECTYCARCCDDLLGGVCPNCSGELLPRPVRPAALRSSPGERPDRVRNPVDLVAHDATLSTRPDVGDHAGVVLRRYAAAWRGGDLGTLVDCYHPGFTLHYGGGSRFAGTHRGLDTALEVMAQVSSVAPRELVSVDEVLVGDNGGALVVTERLTRDGESVELGRTLRYRVQDGRLAECWLFEHDRDTVDRLWA